MDFGKVVALHCAVVACWMPVSEECIAGLGFTFMFCIHTCSLDQLLVVTFNKAGEIGFVISSAS